MNDNKYLIDLVKVIGERENCSDEELLLFLPNYPTLHGSEFIFTIGWANAKKFMLSDVEFFIRGLHCIEMKYKELSKHAFGFGSPSPTAKMIAGLNDTQLAKKLTKWVSQNGGNYYIPKASYNSLLPEDD